MILKKRITGLILILLSISTPKYVIAQVSIKKLQSVNEQKYGEIAAETITNWQALLESSTDLSTEEKLFKINNFFNKRVRFESDRQIWQQTDYWATPLETLAKARGDCEDFSIAKYFSLILLGIPEEQLQLTYVNATRSFPGRKVNQTHMVVTYFPEDSGSLVLDNLVSEIRPSSERSDLKTIFSFNDDGFWVDGENQFKSPEKRIRRWGEVKSRMQAEGLL
ncbi:transglutaminase-like cysteine peptidase [Aliamphritea ceti]|uniref:transglutaminase-like cysteine peptidase n=1 Tax=Aliamphritea ceti TaxID=1524258 RepID=UPI0021C3F3E1|nr:transglutaminase-like cysteine peptidase [Aliamphritea ceti]